MANTSPFSCVLPTQNNLAGTASTANDPNHTMTTTHQSNLKKGTIGNNISAATDHQNNNLTGEATKGKINNILLVAAIVWHNLI